MVILCVKNITLLVLQPVPSHLLSFVIFLFINDQLMNIYRLSTCTVLMISSVCSFAQASQQLDLHKMVKDGGLTVYNRELSLINEPGHLGITLS